MRICRKMNELRTFSFIPERLLDLFPLAIWKHFTSNLETLQTIAWNFQTTIWLTKINFRMINFQNTGVLKCIKVEENIADHIMAWWDTNLYNYLQRRLLCRSSTSSRLKATCHEARDCNPNCNPTHGTDIEHHAAAFFTALNRELEFCTTANKKADWCRI